METYQSCCEIFFWCKLWAHHFVFLYLTILLDFCFFFVLFCFQKVQMDSVVWMSSEEQETPGRLKILRRFLWFIGTGKYKFDRFFDWTELELTLLDWRPTYRWPSGRIVGWWCLTEGTYFPMALRTDNGLMITHRWTDSLVYDWFSCKSHEKLFFRDWLHLLTLGQLKLWTATVGTCTTITDCESRKMSFPDWNGL